MRGKITEKFAEKKINREIEKYQQDLQKLNVRKKELSNSKYMVKQGSVSKLDDKIRIITAAVLELQNSKEIVKKESKPLRMSSVMIDFIRAKTISNLEEIDNNETEKTVGEKENDVFESNMQEESTQKISVPVIENTEERIPDRVRPIQEAETTPKLKDDNKIISYEEKAESVTKTHVEGVDPIEALVQETILRQQKVENSLKAESEKLKEATEQKNNNITELKKLIEERNERIAEQEAQVQEKRRKVAEAEQEDARVKAAIDMLLDSYKEEPTKRNVM